MYCIVIKKSSVIKAIELVDISEFPSLDQGTNNKTHEICINNTFRKRKSTKPMRNPELQMPMPMRKLANNSDEHQRIARIIETRK
jgi:hypothetical protein